MSRKNNGLDRNLVATFVIVSMAIRAKITRLIRNEIAPIFVSVILLMILVGNACATAEFEGNPFWVSSASENTQGLAFGDVDNDGDLDLAVGNYGRQDSLYMNNGGTFETIPSWKSMDSSSTCNVAWGDVDNDGDLDLATGGESGSRLYMNNGGTLGTSPSWVGGGGGDVAWGDFDDDGFLDLAAGKHVYLNIKGALDTIPCWGASEYIGTCPRLAWGDVDNDGDLDLAIGTQCWGVFDNDYVYLNSNGQLETTASLKLEKPGIGTDDLVWVDFDNDGDLDLSTSHYWESSLTTGRGYVYVYLNEGNTLETSPTILHGPAHWISMAWEDMDLDGDFDLAAMHGIWGGSSNYMYPGIYENDNNEFRRIWETRDVYPMIGNWCYRGYLAWGDIDNDGDPDLAVGNPFENRIYRNIGEYNQPPVANAGGPYSGTTGCPIIFDASGSYDPDGEIILYAWDWDNDGTYELTISSPTMEHAWDAAFNGSIGLKVTDNDGLSATDTATVTITPNLPPVADPNGPYLGPLEICFDGTGSDDPDGDLLTYYWDFGDGNTGSDVTPCNLYAEAGIYNVCLTVNDGTVDSQEVCTSAVIYDPSAGFVTGGGWIDSPEGAYKPDASLTGKANFGFVSKYKKGATAPTGQTEFQFQTASLNFHSDSYQWLVVTANYAKFKGGGTINGGYDENGNAYKFMLWAGDGSLDTFRIKVWSEDDEGNETAVYDNGFDQEISGGQVVIHVKEGV